MLTAAEKRKRRIDLIGLVMGMKKSPEIRSWTVNRSSTIIKDSWIDLRADDCATPAGVNISPYYVLRYPDWVHSICLDQDDRVCVVTQYRHGASRVMMELPGGVVEVGEDPLEAARQRSESCLRKPESVPADGAHAGISALIRQLILTASMYLRVGFSPSKLRSRKRQRKFDLSSSHWIN